MAGTDLIGPGAFGFGSSGSPLGGSINQIYSMLGPASGGSLGSLGSSGANTLTSGVGNLAGNFTNNPGNVNQFYPNQSLLQTTAPNLLTGGSNILNAGLGVTGNALQALNIPNAFYQGILSGNMNDITQQAAPYANNLSNVVAGATTAANQGIRGGQTAQTAANLPYTQANAVNNMLLGMIPQALTGEANVGQAIGSIGAGLQGMGSGLIGQGLGASQAAMTGANQKQEINQQAGSVFGDIMKALGVAGNVAGGIGGLLTGMSGMGGGGGGSYSEYDPSQSMQPSFGNPIGFYPPPSLSSGVGGGIPGGGSDLTNLFGGSL